MKIIYPMNKIIKKILILFIKAYQIIISPFFPGKCRYVPSCSNYAIDAIKQKGIMVGMYKSIIRILKCNPFFPGGYDPVK
jgi:hypothetical protein